MSIFVFGSDPSVFDYFVPFFHNVVFRLFQYVLFYFALFSFGFQI